MGKQKAPAPPSPVETSKAQTGTNIGTAIANNQMQMMGQETPYGSLAYEQTGETAYTDPYTGQTYQIPSYKATTTLSPAEQYKLEKNQAAEMSLADVAKDRSDFLKNHFQTGMGQAGLPARGEIPDAPELGRMSDADYSADRQRVEDALMERLNKQFDRDRDAMQTRLVNQGITLGSEAYGREQDDFNRGVTDARLGAILAAGQEQNRLAGLDAQRTGFNNDAALQEFGAASNISGMSDAQRAQAMQEQFALRNQPINEITALLSGSQVSNPNVSPVSPQGAATTDVAGLINQNYNQRLGAWQQNQQNRNSIMGGLFGLGSAGIMGGLF